MLWQPAEQDNANACYEKAKVSSSYFIMKEVSPLSIHLHETIGTTIWVAIDDILTYTRI